MGHVRDLSVCSAGGVPGAQQQRARVHGWPGSASLPTRAQVCGVPLPRTQWGTTFNLHLPWHGARLSHVKSVLCHQSWRAHCV